MSHMPEHLKDLFKFKQQQKIAKELEKQTKLASEAAHQSQSQQLASPDAGRKVRYRRKEEEARRLKKEEARRRQEENAWRRKEEQEEAQKLGFKNAQEMQAAHKKGFKDAAEMQAAHKLGFKNAAKMRYAIRAGFKNAAEMQEAHNEFEKVEAERKKRSLEYILFENKIAGTWRKPFHFNKNIFCGFEKVFSLGLCNRHGHLHFFAYSILQF